jgi:hypothetical protein
MANVTFAAYTREQLLLQKAPALKQIANTEFGGKFGAVVKNTELIDYILKAQKSASEKTVKAETAVVTKLETVEEVNPPKRKTAAEKKAAKAQAVKAAEPAVEVVSVVVTQIPVEPEKIAEPAAVEEKSEPAVEVVEVSTAPTYEERLILFLDNLSEQDNEAKWLQANFGIFKDSLQTFKPVKAKAAKTANTGLQLKAGGADQATKNAAKMVDLKFIYGSVEKCKPVIGPDCDEKTAFKKGVEDAAAGLGKSAYYTKLQYLMVDLYNRSEVVRSAYDAGTLNATGLYDLVFRSIEKKFGLAGLEDQVKALNTPAAA